ncbi:MAG: LptA/OstA family protein [Desulfomonilaceae bacterium]
MDRVILIALLVAYVWLFPVCCFCQTNHVSAGGPSDQPINITSKRFSAKNIPGGKEVTFEGTVKVQQGDLILTCDRLIIIYDDKMATSHSGSARNPSTKELQTPSGVKSITALGNVKITQNDRMAVAGKAIFDNVKRTITLTEGPPRLWQGPDVLAAQTIIIYLDENRSELLGGEESMITAIINPPKPKKDKEK